MRRGLNPRELTAQDILIYVNNREQLMEEEGERAVNIVARGIGEMLDSIGAAVGNAVGRVLS